MQVTDLLAQLGGLKQIAGELGVSEQQAASGAAALAPAILGGLKKQASGGADLGGLLGQLGGTALLDDVLATHPTDAGKGNTVLGTIFGSKDVSRAVAQHAASQSGVDASVLKKMLPLLAMAVTGLMAKQTGSSATSAAGGLGGLLGGAVSGALGGALGGGKAGGLLSMLDADGDGNPLDDIMGMLKRPS